LQIDDLDLILGKEDGVLPLYSKREDRFSSSILGILCELPKIRNQILAQLLNLEAHKIFSVLEIRSQYPGFKLGSRPDGRLLLILRDEQHKPRILRIVALEAKMRGYPLKKVQLDMHCKTLKESKERLTDLVKKMIIDETQGRKIAFDRPEINKTELQLLIFHSKEDNDLKPDGRKTQNVDVKHKTWEEICRIFTDADVSRDNEHISWLLDRILLKMREIQRFALEDDMVNEGNVESMIEIAVSLAIKKLQDEGIISGFAKKYKGHKGEAIVRKEWTRHGINFGGDNFQWQFIGYVNADSNMGAELFSDSDWNADDKRLLLSIDVDPYDEKTSDLRDAIRKCANNNKNTTVNSFDFPSNNSDEGRNHTKWRQVIWSRKKEELYGKKLSDIVEELMLVSILLNKIRTDAINYCKWESA
jgi:hypothetical protein